jgi:hypothetical protein
VGLTASLNGMEKGKFLNLPGLELRPLGRPARSHLLSRLSLNNNNDILHVCTNSKKIYNKESCKTV